MTMAFTIAKKELRTLFHSPVALLFLALFQALALFLFFNHGRFFARGLADIRPLFAWLPVLLIFLVAAITMRSWAEERKAGTLEVLLTLPIRTVDLVLGKFLAGLALVGIALAMMLVIPITVATLGPLDWGPVIGGFTAAMLLASAYLAIGLCVSARTDNQIVALLVTLALGGVLWLIGTETVGALFSASTAEGLRALGTGSRFESIERGVVDVRDLAYYGSITFTFLALNVLFIDRERIDAHSEDGKKRFSALAMVGTLVGANAFALNVWLAPIHTARVDLTEHGTYSISDVTVDALKALDEPVQLRAFLSERTHPKLAPLIPQIRDTLAEYEVYGNGRVHVDVVDPNTNEDIEAEITEQYAIRSLPIGIDESHAQSIVNAYFHILVSYGDQYEVLGFDDLIDARAEGTGIDVRLKNLEYDLTRTIKRVSQEFQTLEGLLAKLPEGASLTAYVSPATLPEGHLETVETMRSVAQDIAAKSQGRVTFSDIDPTTDAALSASLAETFGIRPIAADIFGTQRYYAHLLLQAGDHVEGMLPRGGTAEADLRQAIEATLRRATPGQLKKVGLMTEVPQAPPPQPGMPPGMQPPAPQPDYAQLERVLAENFEVERLQLADGRVPVDIDVLIVGKTGALTPHQQYAIDQFLMRGGSIIALAGSYRAEASRRGLAVQAESRSLFELLDHWGVEVGTSLVMDEHVATFPLPVPVPIGGGRTLQRIELLPYPFFPDVGGKMLNDGHPVLSGITSMTVPWGSPLSTPETLEGRDAVWLATSTDRAWLNDRGTIDPDATPEGVPTWVPSDDRASHHLAVAVTGRFPSYFADRNDPTAEFEAGNSGATLSSSVSDGRLIVVGSSEVASDLIEIVAAQTQSLSHSANKQFLLNAIEWSVEADDLLTIRTTSPFARGIETLSPDQAAVIEARTWLLVAAGLLGLALGTRRRRPSPTPQGPQAQEPSA